MTCLSVLHSCQTTHDYGGKFLDGFDKSVLYWQSIAHITGLFTRTQFSRWFLVNDQRDAQVLLYVFISIITLYVFRAHSANHQERQIVSIQPLVTVILCWWPRCVQVGRRVQPAHIPATNIEWLLQEAVLIQFVSPDDEHRMLETRREL
jgi:hypothetical protein